MIIAPFSLILLRLLEQEREKWEKADVFYFLVLILKLFFFVFFKNVVLRLLEDVREKCKRTKERGEGKRERDR